MNIQEEEEWWRWNWYRVVVVDWGRWGGQRGGMGEQLIQHFLHQISSSLAGFVVGYYWFFCWWMQVHRGDSSERRVRMVAVVLLVRRRVTVVECSDRQEVVLAVDNLAGCFGTSLGWNYPLCDDKSSNKQG